MGAKRPKLHRHFVSLGTKKRIDDWISTVLCVSSILYFEDSIVKFNRIWGAPLNEWRKGQPNKFSSEPHSSFFLSEPPQTPRPSIIIFPILIDNDFFIWPKLAKLQPSRHKQKIVNNDNVARKIDCCCWRSNLPTPSPNKPNLETH